MISETSLIFKYELATVLDKLKTQQTFKDEDYGLQYLKYTDASNKTVQFPMIIVEEASSLEIRDCYMRSIRKDGNVIN